LGLNVCEGQEIYGSTCGYSKEFILTIKKRNRKYMVQKMSSKCIWTLFTFHVCLITMYIVYNMGKYNLTC
jgi:hypothetical protein